MNILFSTMLAIVFVVGTITYASAQNDISSENNASTINSQSNITNTTSNSAQDPTSIVITPNPAKILQGSSIQYIATVTDTAKLPQTPTGIISWIARTNVGQFQTKSCVLESNNANPQEASCTVNYTAPAYCTCSVPVTIVASYQGDSSHRANSSSANLISLGGENITANIVSSATQVIAGSPVQLTVTVTDSSGSPVTAADVIGVIAYDPLSEDLRPVGGTFIPDSCTLSANVCVFSYTPPLDYHGTVQLTPNFLRIFGGIPHYGSTTLQVTPNLGEPSTTPSETNMIVAQHGNITVRFISSFGAPGFNDGQLATPQGITLDQSGNIYVAEMNSKRVDKFDSTGHFISKIGTNLLKAPTNVAIDKLGNIYVVDVTNEVVYKFDSAGNFVSKFGIFGMAELANINDIEPQGIALDDSNNVYLTDFADIQKYDSNDNFMFKFGTFGSGNGQLHVTGDMAIDKSGYIYVADGNQRIEKFDSTGAFQGWIGGCISGTNCDTSNHVTTGFCNDCVTMGKGIGDGQFTGVQGIAIDKSGNIWVTDELNNRIQVFDSSGNFLFTFGTAGSNPGQFDEPNDIVFDNSGNMYVTDQVNNRIQIFHIDYDVRTSSSLTNLSTDSSQISSHDTTTSQTTKNTPKSNLVPTLSSVSMAPGWVKKIFSFHDQGQISDTDLINTISFLIQQGVIKLE